MKRALLPIATAMLFAAAAFAQPATQGATSNSGSSSAMQGGMSNSSSMGTSGSKKMHKIEGCVEQANGQYMLKTKHGKDIPLTGQDVAAHDGHTVVLTGTWENSTMGETSSTASASHAFDVTNVRMVSDTCKWDHSKMGTSK
jgi:hypothetical protein